MRKIGAVDKVFPKSINIEKTFDQPIKKLFQSLEALVGGSAAPLKSPSSEER